MTAWEMQQQTTNRRGEHCFSGLSRIGLEKNMISSNQWWWLCEDVMLSYISSCMPEAHRLGVVCIVRLKSGQLNGGRLPSNGAQPIRSHLVHRHQHNWLCIRETRLLAAHSASSGLSHRAGLLRSHASDLHWHRGIRVYW